MEQSASISETGGNTPRVSERDHTILLVDPEKLVRHAIREMINAVDGYNVVAEASGIQDAFEALGKYGPQIIISEIALPGPSGLELLFELQRRKISGVRAVVLSSVDQPDMIKQALLAGAQGYILKNTSHEDFVNALYTIGRNKRYIPPELERLANVQENAYELAGQRPEDPLGPLSPREREIFHLLANGLQNTVIAKKLFISPRTVETHRARVVRKLGLSSNGELIRFAIKHGLTVV